MFSRSRNTLLTFLLSYDVWVISKIQVNLRFERYWWSLTLTVLWIFEIFTLFVFSRSGNLLLIFLQSYHVWVISKIQVHFRFKTYSEVLVNVSYRFLKFLDYPCLWGQRIHCWYFCRATMFGWPRKYRLTSGPTCTQRYWWLCLVDFWNFFTIYVFKVSESFGDIPTELLCLGDLKNAGHLLVQEVFEVTQTFVPWQKKTLNV